MRQVITEQELQLVLEHLDAGMESYSKLSAVEEVMQAILDWGGYHDFKLGPAVGDDNIYGWNVYIEGVMNTQGEGVNLRLAVLDAAIEHMKASTLPGH